MTFQDTVTASSSPGFFASAANAIGNAVSGAFNFVGSNFANGFATLATAHNTADFVQGGVQLATAYSSVLPAVTPVGAVVLPEEEAAGLAAEAAGSSRIFYATPEGQLIEAPAGYEAVTAENGSGLVLKPSGQVLGENSNIIRYGEPNTQNPNGYFRYYNGYGQPLNPATGQPGSNPITHIPLNYQGPLNGYPRGL